MMIDRDAIEEPVDLLMALMRRDFGTFLRKAYASIRGGEMIAWNWHLGAIAHQLDLVASGERRRLLVTMPPRNLKSITISVAWVAWMLGQDPRLNFVCVSYSNELSAKMARDCLAILQQPWYRELFPRTMLSSKRIASGDFETTVGGGRLATSITGTITGRGGDIVIVDDPIKPEEAYSETTREFVNQWFKTTLAARLDDKARGAIITVMQRLHEHDLAGMLLEDGTWYQLSLPAIAKTDQSIPMPGGRNYHRRVDDVLHAARESRAVLDEQRALMGSMAFEAQYQQDPVPALGNLVKAEWLQTHDSAFDPKGSGLIVQSWDTANKEGLQNDFSVCITAHVQRAHVRVLDVFRRRLAFPDLKHHAFRLAREHRSSVLLIEDQAAGTQLIQTIRAEQPAGVVLPVPIHPEGDKQSRMMGVSAQIEAGRLSLPEDAPWLGEFKAELLGFPNARHDDQADALSQLMAWVMRQSAMEDRTTIAGPELVLTDEYGNTILSTSEGNFVLTTFDNDGDNDDPWV